MPLTRTGAANHALESDKRFVGSPCRRLFNRVGCLSGGHRVQPVGPKLDGTTFVDPAARAVDFSNVDLNARKPVLDVAKSRCHERLDASLNSCVAMNVIVTVELE
jgi:hypothetical protein